MLSLTLVSGVPVARADGDPASDVLSTYRLFQPSDAPAPAATIARLDAVLAASARSGFPIRVALINSASDLGTATTFWSGPHGHEAGSYAAYLQYELSGMYHGQVLVVMPGSFGLAPRRGGDAVTAAETAAGLRANDGSDLAAAALAAVPVLARAAGHPIDLAEIHVSAVTVPRSHNGLTIIVAVISGLLLIGGCWIWSIRARPLRAGGGHTEAAGA